jgi:uncharacterized SAM-binding protein YcdF (DUF218 family)
MFFSVTKIINLVLNPGSLLLGLLCLGVVLIWTPWRRFARRLVTVTVLVILLAAVLPFGTWLTAPLENRFPVVRRLPERIDGIIALGGVVDQYVTRARGQLSLSGGAERLIEFAALARRYPGAKLVYSGGSGNLFRQDIKEADVLGPFLETLGLDPARVILEDRSRNTLENATETYKLVRPREGENWVLITSAAHMPRAVGVFRKVGWRVIPYPVDFHSTGKEPFKLSFNMVSGLNGLTSGLYYWAGMVFYRLTGKMDSFFPGPEKK